MILSGREIKKEWEKQSIIISPFHDSRINPNSYNVCLSNELLVYTCEVIDMKKPNNTEKITIPESGYILQPGQLYLGRTVEYTETFGFVPMLEGRSSIGRLGINIHATAGFGDVGFKGFWTLEISCIKPVIIYPNVEIGQVYFHTIQGDYDEYTNGKYQNNKGIQPSLLYKDFKGA